MGGLLFGYDIGVMSSVMVMPHWIKFFNDPQSVGIGVIVSILTAGCFVGALAAGWLADKYSRKRTIMAGAVLFVIGSIIQCASANRGMLIAGRFINGLSVGFLSMVVPMFQSELAAPEVRGRLVSLQQWAITWGIMIAFWIDYGCGFISGNTSWRLPLGLQMVPAIILLGGMFFVPFSPRWLVNNDRIEEAQRVLARLRSNGDINAPEVIEELEEIKEAVRIEREAAEYGYIELIKYPIFRRVVLGVGIQIFQQLTGINVVMYFAPKIFEQAGLTGSHASTLAQGVNGVVNMLSTIPAILWVDRWGRRRTLIIGSIVCGGSYLIQAIIKGVTSHPTVNNGDVNLHMPTGPSYAIVVMVYIFVCGFAFSWGPIGWIYPSEIFPMHIRSKANSITTAANWLFNFVIGLVCPILLKKITWKLDIIFAIFMTVALICVYLFYPETKNRPLEEMEVVFTGSVWAFKDKKRIADYDISKKIESA
ncbi:general substrate transporter [Martensiomyces pterosporus]|nr:general substrate transporter [Martensiomyces pterosporus]